MNPVSLDVDETGETIEENAKIKALAYSKEYPDVYVICEDSGLVVPGLNNLPGPYSARFHSIVMDDNLELHPQALVSFVDRDAHLLNAV